MSGLFWCPCSQISMVWKRKTHTHTSGSLRRFACHTPIPGPTRMADLNQVRGARLYTGTLIDLFFLRAELVPVGIQTISVITKNHLHIQKNYHQSGVHQNLYTYIESHLLIHVHLLLNIFCSSGIQNIIILLHWSLHLIQTLIHIHI